MTVQSGASLAFGLFAGTVSYYAMSLASAFWGATEVENHALWSVVLGVAMCTILAATTVRYCVVGLTCGVVMILLGVTGFALGSAEFAWAMPIPTDFRALFLHGARSPLLYSTACFTVAAGASLMSVRSNRASQRRISSVERPR